MKPYFTNACIHVHTTNMSCTYVVSLLSTVLMGGDFLCTIRYNTSPFFAGLLSSLRQKCFSDGCNPVALARDHLPIVDWLGNYKVKKDLSADVIAGFTIAIMHIPQGNRQGCTGTVGIGIVIPFLRIRNGLRDFGRVGPHPRHLHRHLPRHHLHPLRALQTRIHRYGIN